MKKGCQSFEQNREKNTGLYCGRFCLRPLTQADVPEVRRFLLRFEYRCTALTSFFARRSVPQDSYRFSFPSRDFCFVLEYNSAKDGVLQSSSAVFAGLLYYSCSGILYHCIPFMEQEYQNQNLLSDAFSGDDKKDMELLCTEFFEKHYPKSIMGGSGAGRFLEPCMNYPVSEVRPCKLMSLTPAYAFSSCNDCTLPDGYRLHRCTIDDSERLFDLMKAYYIEEVIPAGMSADNQTVRLLLHQRLNKQLVFALQNTKGEFEAMAATTALGMQTARLGSIYTPPHLRRKGFASALVRHLSMELFNLHYTPVLFVRSSNPGAEALYRKCGFSVCGGYRIAYF